MKSRFILFCFLIPSLLLSAAEPGKRSYHFSYLTMDQGLSSNAVYCMLQDSSGYMWFGTFSGLNRYDGRSTQVFRPRIGDSGSLGSSVIFSLLEDRDGRLWVGTDGGGLSLFNRETLDFSSFRNDPDNPLSLSSNQVFALEEDHSGRLWIGTAGGGLCLYRGEGLFFILDQENSSLVSNRIRTLYCDKEGILWIGTEKGLSLYDTESGHFLSSDSVTGMPLLDNLFIRDIKADALGNVWLGTEKGLFLFNRKEGVLSSFSLPREVSVRSISLDSMSLWIGTERSGVLIYDFMKDSWDTLRSTGKDGSLSYDKIRSLYRDHNGLVWIATRGGGVNLYNPAVSLMETHNELKDIRNMVERRDGSIWIGTDGSGIGVLDRQSGRIKSCVLSPSDSQSDNDHVYSFMEDSGGTLWIGTDGSGLYRLPPGKSPEEAEHFPLHNPDTGASRRMTVWAILEDADGNVWVGTEGEGLYVIQGDNISHYGHEPEDPESLNGNAVRCLFEDSRGKIWVGTWDGGLNLYKRNTGKFKRFVRSASLPGSLSDNSVNVILEDSSGRLWVGTSGGGVDIYDPGEGRFQNISTQDGLAGDNIYGILEDGRKNIWLSTDTGLSRIGPGIDSVLNYSRADGLLANEFSQNAYFKASDGTLFWGGPRGISSFHPSALSGESHPSDIVITGLSIHNIPIGIGEEYDGRVLLDKDVSLKEEIILPYTANNLSFRFSILSYIDPTKHHYSVQLIGLEEHPRFLGNRNEVSYALIPPGDYTLKLTGTDHNGLHTTQEKELHIRVLAPFWMNPLFLSFSLLFVFSLFALGFWLRLRFLHKNNEQLRNFTMHMEKAREEERKSAAREYHDELGQQLTAMKFDLFWLNGHPQAEEGVRREKIASLLDVVNDAIGSVRSISTNLRPKVLDNLSLKEALEWQSRRFTKRTAIPLALDIHMETPLMRNDPDGEVKTAVFRMYQEILTNVIRHSGADAVEVRITRDREEFRLMVRDNGIGIGKFDINKNNSFGLIGIRERCRHLNGRFLIDNHPEGGTVVRIILPLKE